LCLSCIPIWSTFFDLWIRLLIFKFFPYIFDRDCNEFFGCFLIFCYFFCRKYSFLSFFLITQLIVILLFFYILILFFFLHLNLVIAFSDQYRTLLILWKMLVLEHCKLLLVLLFILWFCWFPNNSFDEYFVM
jgi:hypothetical protein